MGFLDYNDKLANTAQAAFNFNLTKQFLYVVNYKVKNIVGCKFVFYSKYGFKYLLKWFRYCPLFPRRRMK